MSEKINKEMDKSISVKLTNTLLEKARKKSALTGVSLSFVVRKAIETWVDEQENQSKDSLSNKSRKSFGSLSMGKVKFKT